MPVLYCYVLLVFFFKQKTAYELRISDWSSDVCSSDLIDFDAEGRLWGLEHGPAGGDELNLIKPGENYGWPLVSGGYHYDGKPIPRHSTRPDQIGRASCRERVCQYV